MWQQPGETCQEWLDRSEQSRLEHLRDQEAADRAYRRAHGYQETRGDEERWQHLQADRPSAPAFRVPAPPRVHTTPRNSAHTLAVPSPRVFPVPSGRLAAREGARSAPTHMRSQLSRECSICVEEKPFNSFPQVTGACRHDASACIECLQNWLGSAINGMNWNRISCVQVDCNQILQYEDIRKIARAETLQRYGKYSTRDAVGAIANFRYCLNPSCESGQEHVPGADSMFVCNECDIVPAPIATEPGMPATLVFRPIPQEDKQMRLCHWREFGELHRDA